MNDILIVTGSAIFIALPLMLLISKLIFKDSLIRVVGNIVTILSCVIGIIGYLLGKVYSLADTLWILPLAVAIVVASLFYFDRYVRKHLQEIN